MAFELRVAADTALASVELVPLDDGKFTTQDFSACEQSLNDVASEMVKSGGFKVNQSHVDQAIKDQNARLQNLVGANLSDEQVTAIRHVLAPHQLSTVVGLAGAGKSTLLAAAKDAWEAQGYSVFGAALAGKAADSLQNASGIASRTLASLEASWKSGYEPVPAGSILVVDEAGMVGTRQLDRVTQALQQRGCKLVLIGDPDQLQPIQAGRPFRDIVQTCGAAHLNEIRRQETDWQRQASHDLAAGRASEALQAYADHGGVKEAEDRDHAIAALVEDYMGDCKSDDPNRSRLALAHRRIDVHAINQGIKAAKQAMAPTRSEILFDTDHGPRTFAAGDRILFTRNDKVLGVRNGMLGTVSAAGMDRLEVKLDTSEHGAEQTLIFSPTNYSAIDHGFAVSIHRAQGCTVDRSFVLSSKRLDKNLAYVAMTRHKQKTGFYTAPDIAPKRLGLEIRKSELQTPKIKVPKRTR